MLKTTPHLKQTTDSYEPIIFSESKTNSETSVVHKPMIYCFMNHSERHAEAIVSKISLHSVMGYCKKKLFYDTKC